MRRVSLFTGDNLFRVKDLKNPLAHLFTGRVDIPGSWPFGKARTYWYLTHQSGSTAKRDATAFLQGGVYHAVDFGAYFEWAYACCEEAELCFQRT